MKLVLTQSLDAKPFFLINAKQSKDRGPARFQDNVCLYDYQGVLVLFLLLSSLYFPPYFPFLLFLLLSLSTGLLIITGAYLRCTKDGGVSGGIYPDSDDTARCQHLFLAGPHFRITRSPIKSTLVFGGSYALEVNSFF